MKGIPLKAIRREVGGSAQARRLRKAGYIPAVVYGVGEKPLSISVPKKDFSKIVYSHLGEHAMVILEVEGEGEKKSIPSIIREVQHDPTSDLIIHADFEHVRLDKPIFMVLPLEFIGTPIGVKKGGIFMPHLHEIEVLCAPNDAPDVVEIDIEKLELGSTIHIANISIPNARILHSPDETIASVVKQRGIIEEAPKAETAEEVAPTEEETAKR